MNAIYCHALVRRHLGPFIRGQKWTYEETILDKADRSRRRFSEEELLETYVDFACRELHRVHAVRTLLDGKSHHDRICRELPMDQQEEHCQKVAEAVHRAVQHDFKRTFFPTQDHLQGTVKRILREVYDEEMQCTIHVLLKRELDRLSTGRDFPSCETLTKEIEERARERFPSSKKEVYLETRCDLLENVRTRLGLLKAEIECKQCLGKTINRVYKQCRSKEAIPKPEDLVWQIEGDFAHLAEMDRKELRERLIAFANDDLRGLKAKFGLDCTLLRRAAPRFDDLGKLGRIKDSDDKEAVPYDDDDQASPMMERQETLEGFNERGVFE